MNVLLSTIGRRGYLADYFNALLSADDNVIGTTDRHSASSEYSVGLLSCDRQFLLPSINSDAYVASLLDICESEHVGLLTSLFDEDALVLSRHLHEFSKLGVAAIISNQLVSETCYDKKASIDFLKQHGFQYPKTWYSLQDCISETIVYPVCVKPRRGSSGIGLHIAHSMEKLKSAVDSPEQQIIQECVDCPEYGIDIFNDDNGRTVSCVVRRKLKMRAGETDQAITVRDSRLIDFAVHLGEALGHTGSLDVDLFVRHDEPLVIDMNPRIGGGYPLSHAAGVNFPEMMLKLARGEKIKSSIGNYPEGIVMMKSIDPVFSTVQELENQIHR